MFVAEKDVYPINQIEIPKETHPVSMGVWDTYHYDKEYSDFSETPYSRQRNLHDEYNDYIDEIEKKTGEKLDNPFKSAWGEWVEDVISSFNDNEYGNEVTKAEVNQERLDKFYREVDKLSKDHEDLPIKSLADMQENIMNKAEEWRQKNAEPIQKSTIGSFLGKAVSYLQDPFNLSVNLVTLPFTGGAGSTILATAGKAAVTEGAINTVIETAGQLPIYNYKQELGDNYTVGEAVGNVAMAGLTGGIFAGGAVVGGSLLKKSISKLRAYEKKGGKLAQDVADSLDVAERKLDFDDFAKSTSFTDDEIDLIFHERAIAEEQNRLLIAQERADFAKGWDKVGMNPKGDPQEILARITPDDMKEIVFERGEWSKVEQGYSNADYGAVKFRWKHGDFANDTLPIMKNDVVDFPNIVREYEPMTNDIYGDTQYWSVYRKDGVQVLYAARQIDGKQTMVTIHTIKNGDKSLWKGVISPKKNSLSKTPSPNSPNQTQAYRSSGSGEVHTGELTQRSGVQAQRQAIDNISPNYEKVKTNGEVAYPSADDIEKILADEDFVLPDVEIEGQLQTKKASQVLSDLKKQDSYIDEITECIVEFGKK